MKVLIHKRHLPVCIHTLLLWLLLPVLVTGMHLNDSDQKDMKSGVITDTVVCTNNEDYSYALYLPVNYNRNKEWPVIFLFDPGAKGALAVQTFKSAAESFGYILAASNNSKNGLPWNRVNSMAESMMKDVKERFSINAERIYLSGFSGGARVASLLAFSNEVSGIIGCGAGFPFGNTWPELIPDFDYIGLAGNFDMNYQELFLLEQELSKRGVTARILNSDYGHSWPPEDLIYEAVEWMELQAMRRNIIAENTYFIDTLYEKKMSVITNILEEGNIIEAVRTMRWMIDDFKGFSDVSPVQHILDSCEHTKKYASDLKTRIKMQQTEIEQQKMFSLAFSGLVFSNALNDSTRNWWFTNIKKLNKFESSSTVYKSQMATRIKGYVAMGCYMNYENLSKTSKYDKLILLSQIWTIAEPENSSAYYYLARSYALNHETKKALEALEKCFSAGFNKTGLILEDEAFSIIKSDERFKELIKKNP